MRRLLKLDGVRFIEFDMCQYNTSWGKGTRMLVWGTWSEHFPAKKCQGHGAVCSRTHRPHIMLSAVANGRFRTSAARVYPSASTDQMAKACVRASSFCPCSV